jgi:hypothetical protein
MMNLKVLVEKAYGELSVGTTEILVQFIKSLPTEILLQPKLETTDNFLQEALKAEEVEHSTRKSKAVATVSSPTDPMVEAIKLLMEKLDRLEQGQAVVVARVQQGMAASSLEDQPTGRLYQFLGNMLAM